MNDTTTPPYDKAILIRAAAPDDAESLRELRVEALSANPTAFGADAAAAAADPAAAWVERVARYAAEEQGLIAVAVGEGRPIGMAGLAREHWPKTRHCATLWGVYVRPAWRGRRVAEALLGECLAWARDHGVSLVKLGVVTTNTPAIRCYARCGFTVYGVDPQTICHDGLCYDELLMARRP